MKKRIVLLVLLVAIAPPATAWVQDPGPEPNPQEVPAPLPENPEDRVIVTPFGRVVIEGQQPAPEQAPPAPESPEATPVPVPEEPAPGPEVATPAPGAEEPAPGPEAATPEAAAGQVPGEPSPVQLQLDNADIYQVIRIIGDALGLNYIIDPSVQGTVNISTSSSLQRSDLLPILETLLKINGATMVQTGNFYQVIPAGGAVRESLIVQDGVIPTAPGDEIVMQILRMKYVPAPEMASLLNPYLSGGGNITVHATGNILIVTERRGNLRKLLEIVDIFDSDVFEGERIRLFPVTNALASDLIEDLQSIFSGYAFSTTSAVRFVPIARLNSIMVVTPNSAVFSEVEKWLRRLDQPLQTSGIQNFVYKVRNAKAIDIQQVLVQLYIEVLLPVDTLSEAAPALDLQAPPSQITGPTTTPFDQPSEPILIFNQGVKIIADEMNNALVIQATPQMYAEIERTILQLDIVKRQVLIDAQIYEVVLDDSIAFGLSATLQNRGTLQHLTTASVDQSGALNVATFALIGRSRELLMFLNASENRSRVRTLSAPSVLVSDNMTAQFQVGAEVPIPVTSSLTPVQSDGTNLFAQTIQFRTTGVLLSVRPQINDSGLVTLEIVQEVSQAGGNTTSAIVAPVIGKAAVSSTIVVRDGETIALAGFIRESNELVRSRVPVIGRIPGLGLLFGSTRRATTRSEIIILITPHVIRNFDESQQVTEELKSKLAEVQQLLQ